MQQPVIPEVGFLRITQICGDKKRGIVPIYQISRSAWWCGVKSGRFPKGVLLGPKTRAWKSEDIRELIASTSAGVQ
jgi:prophage regulatory protein